MNITIISTANSEIPIVGFVNKNMINKEKIINFQFGLHLFLKFFKIKVNKFDTIDI